MVMGFDAGGVLLSFRTCYVCPACGTETDGLFDTQLDRGHFEALRAPARQCRACGRPAVLDDDPAILFEYVRATPVTPPPAEVLGVLRSEGSGIDEIPGSRLTTRTTVSSRATTFRLVGVVDQTLPYRRIIESACGETELAVAGVTHFDDGAAESWRVLLDELGRKAEVRLSGCPPALLRRSVDDRGWLDGALVTSVALPARCDRCRTGSWVIVPDPRSAPWLTNTGACPTCSTRMRPLTPAGDVTAFQAALATQRRLRSTSPAGLSADSRTAVGLAVSARAAAPAPTAAMGFAEKYEALAQIGRGGMADIFLVRQHGVMGFRRLVVFKKVRRDRLTDDRLVRLFLDEARLAARLEHPNIIRIHDLGRADDTYYMVIDFIHGRSLVEALRELQLRGEVVPPTIAATIAADVCAGLASAHRPDSTGRILVHRDVTPNNILISFEGNVRLLDFGLAGYHHFRKDALRARSLLGNIPFIAPEIYLGGEALPQTDIWGVGLSLYTMLTGSNPFHRDNAENTAHAVVHERLRRSRSKVPRRLFAVLSRALEKDPLERYDSAADMERELRAAAAKPGGESGVAAWIRGLFARQISVENEFARRANSPSLVDALLQATPQEVVRLYQALQGAAPALLPAEDTGAPARVEEP